MDWALDHVKASGEVYRVPDSNEADLAFNYEILSSAREFEILNYTRGDNWMECVDRVNSVSHFGMHVSAEDLVAWRQWMGVAGIQVAQEVMTESHTNPVIDGKRWYNYVIFDTKHILGVDLKFIVRRDAK